MPLHIHALVPSMNTSAASIGTPIAPPTTEGLNR